MAAYGAQLPVLQPPLSGKCWAQTTGLRRQRPSTGGWRKRPVRPEAKFPKSRAICWPIRASA